MGYMGIFLWLRTLNPKPYSIYFRGDSWRCGNCREIVPPNAYTGMYSGCIGIMDKKMEPGLRQVEFADELSSLLCKTFQAVPFVAEASGREEGCRRVRWQPCTKQSFVITFLQSLSSIQHHG